MFYSIRHLTRFAYSAPISESIMELRMQPRTEGGQRCLSFDLTTSPRARLLAYRDYLGNIVHHFDIPGRHSQLRITAESMVEVSPSSLPDSLSPEAWREVDEAASKGEHWDSLRPSTFVSETELLKTLARELGMGRRDDPLTLLREMNEGIYNAFDYSPQTTQVDSPIDHALEDRRGVCQDFAHIMLALVRGQGIPARYVSGYLYHGAEDHDRSAAGATHAWIEAWLPGLGWVGFDPTNNLIAGERHIRTAIGRDYADVPPTRGVFRGKTSSELTVGVQVTPSDAPPPADEIPQGVTWTSPVQIEEEEQQQQQQQQQQ
ncbi:MAG: transglutaminase family protein [Acidobacteria bacterium]|nr:transglutaminase family protein [Acidobacteriota bacterium]MCW5969378.1 transglutaminase family protein [Blastocatellales bacterium]